MQKFQTIKVVLCNVMPYISEIVSNEFFECDGYVMPLAPPVNLWVAITQQNFLGIHFGYLNVMGCIMKIF